MSINVFFLSKFEAFRDKYQCQIEFNKSQLLKSKFKMKIHFRFKFREQRIWPELAALFDIRIVVGFIFFLLSFFIALFTQYR